MLPWVFVIPSILADQYLLRSYAKIEKNTTYKLFKTKSIFEATLRTLHISMNDYVLELNFLAFLIFLRFKSRLVAVSSD